MTQPPDVDVLIVGAGLSGIGAAARLSRELPGKTFRILEARSASGGTWDLFRYPGIRSDSDMFTLGFDFKPWRDDVALADGDRILAYLRETVEDYGLEARIRYDEPVQSASWSSALARWTVTTPTGEHTASFLWVCSGYYDYDEPYTPPLPGLGRFAGPVVHPQHWPAELDYEGRRVVVIGSGATAVSLVPALAAGGAGSVTMLQRSPTYVLSLAGRDRIARTAGRWLSPERAYRLVRRKNVAVASAFYRLSRARPRLVRRLVRAVNRRLLPGGYPVDVHFKPSYDPWDQRMCFVPDADLFRAIADRSVEVVTDRIVSITPTGMVLESGRELEADIVVTATGLNLKALGGITFDVDGEPVDLTHTMAYRAMMLAGLPNLAFTIGYTNATWTLKADLVAGFVCRLLAYLDATGRRQVVPVPDPSVQERPLMDFTPGYVLRALDRLPQQGDREPWRLRQSYTHDRRTLAQPLDDGVLRFS